MNYSNLAGSLAFPIPGNDCRVDSATAYRAWLRLNLPLAVRAGVSPLLLTQFIFASVVLNLIPNSCWAERPTGHCRPFGLRNQSCTPPHFQGAYIRARSEASGLTASCGPEDDLWLPTRNLVNVMPARRLSLHTTPDNRVTIVLHSCHVPHVPLAVYRASVTCGQWRCQRLGGTRRTLCNS
eukprot:1063794-Rhodomonas_salina.1